MTTLKKVQEIDVSGLDMPHNLHFWFGRHKKENILQLVSKNKLTWNDLELKIESMKVRMHDFDSIRQWSVESKEILGTVYDWLKMFEFDRIPEWDMRVDFLKIKDEFIIKLNSIKKSIFHSVDNEFMSLIDDTLRLIEKKSQ